MQGAGGSSGGGGGIDGGGSGSGVATDDLHEELVEPWWNVTDRGVLTADDEREELAEPWWKTQNCLYAAKRAESGKYGLFALTPVGRPHEGVEQRWRPVLPSPRQPRRTLQARAGRGRPLSPNRPVYEDMVACGGAPVNTLIEVFWSGAPGSNELDLSPIRLRVESVGGDGTHGQGRLGLCGGCARRPAVFRGQARG